MRKEEISKMGTEELTKKLRSSKITTGIIIGLVIAMIVVAIVQSSEDTSLSAKLLPIAFLPIVITNIVSTVKLRKELTSRQVK